MRLDGTESDWRPLLVAGVHCGFDGHGRLFGNNLQFLCVHRSRIHDSRVTEWLLIFEMGFRICLAGTVWLLRAARLV